MKGQQSFLPEHDLKKVPSTARGHGCSVCKWLRIYGLGEPKSLHWDVGGFGAHFTIFNNRDSKVMRSFRAQILSTLSR